MESPREALSDLPPESKSPHEEGSIHASSDSQTASEFINGQLQLEADAREALPYSFDHCTQPLGALRQNLFSCLTCNPPPASPLEPYNPAGVCYSCSIACHGEHTLVELFNKRNFTCDCGTTRLPSSSPCTLRINPATGVKGPVHSQPPAEGNTYNQNFRNRFCGCGEFYDASRERGTMYQCIGMSREEDGGCGEDWWHPECLLGLPRDWYKAAEDGANVERSVGNESTDAATHGDGNEEHPTPPDFPDEEDFEALICYKCTEANPWIKRYAGTRGFLPSLKYGGRSREEKDAKREETTTNAMSSPSGSSQTPADPSLSSKKRKAEDSDSDDSFVSAKKVKAESENFDSETLGESVACYYSSLPPAIDGPISLLSRDEDFRLYFCRCPSCYPSLSKCPQLLEEEESYEPPHSEDGGESMGTGSLLDRGEAALSNVDRVRAIEGVMVYNHLKDKVKSFLQPFAESGQAVGAEDIKAYFEKLRGDAEAVRAAGGTAVAGGSGDDEGDNRREQSGY